jgi:hypothetical protein
LLIEDKLHIGSSTKDSIKEMHIFLFEKIMIVCADSSNLLRRKSKGLVLKGYVHLYSIEQIVKVPGGNFDGVN